MNKRANASGTLFMNHIPSAYSDEDGVLFGESSERRIFFPGSSKRNAAIADDVHVAQQSPSGASRTQTDPLSALGLLPPSPYVALRQHVPQTVPAAAANKDRDEAVTTTTSPSSPPGSVYDATSFSEKGNVSRSPHFDEAAQETVSFEEIYSPQRLQRSGRGRPKGVKFCEKHMSSSTLWVNSPGRIHDRCSLIKPSLDNFGRGLSKVTLIQRLRLNGCPMAEEATQLRQEADPGWMLRRFWRCSGLPLDHIFATAARVYRRSRLQPMFSTWHFFAKKETHRIERRANAAHIIQWKVRALLARRAAERRRRARGSTAVENAPALHGGFRAQQTRAEAIKREACQREGEELLKPQRDAEMAQENVEVAIASNVIQAAWRAAVGRAEGANRARRRLKEVLVELGGGQGRMHRIQDCNAPSACLEHTALARACEVALRISGDPRRQSREVLLLLLRCRLLLIARRQLHGEMRERWGRQAETFTALKAGMDKAQKERALRQGQSRREQDQAQATELRQQEREVRMLHTETKLRELSERQRLEAETLEERGREQRESYFMWREETRQYDITKHARATMFNRELHELVMMRREELLAIEAWALEDATTRECVLLRMHGERISRLFRLASPGSMELGGQRGAENDEEVHPSARRVTDAQKPEATIIDRMDCVMDGRKVKATVALRPSDAASVVFKQAAALRVTVRNQDVARERVAHWGARCRVDAEHAARVRGELFRLKCKTRKERREKAADVAAMTAVAETSILQLRAALKEARRATVARAAALADSLGVNPPKSLLARRVLNEHSERLAVRDVTAGGCTYHSSPARLTTRSDQQKRGREGSRVATSEGPAATADRNQRPHQHHHDHHAPPAQATRSKQALYPDETSEGLSPPRHTSGGKASSRHSHTSPTEVNTAKSTVGSGTNLPAAGARNNTAAKTAPSASSSNAPDLGWNREWCRSVDTWCRSASARFRSRLSGEVVSAARRLHWLAGSGRNRDFGGGACGDARIGSSQSIANCDRGSRGRGKEASAGRCSDRSMPSEQVGAEGWAALAAFGDVADLLEIAGSTAELVITVEVDLINLEPPHVDGGSVVQVQDEMEKAGLSASQDHRGGGVVTDERARSPRVDNSLAHRTTEPNSAGATVSSTSEGSINKQEPAAPALSSAEVLVVSRSRDSNAAGGVSLHNQDPPLQDPPQDTARSEPGSGRGSDAVTRLSHPRSNIFAAKSGTFHVAGTKESRFCSVPRPPKLTAVDEEADTDTASSSDSDQEIAKVDDTFARAEKEASSTGGTVSRSRLDTGNNQDFLLDGYPEAEDSEPASRGYGEGLRSSTTARDLRHDHETASTICTGYLRKPFAPARIILGPAEMEMALGVSSLSMFVLQAARWNQQHLSMRTIKRHGSGGVHGTHDSSLNCPKMANALSSPQRARNDIGKKPSLVPWEESETAEGIPNNRSATSTPRSHSDKYPALPPDALSLGKQAGIRMISATERMGLACAVETMILPHLRIILRSKRRRSTQASGKASTVRLRLKLELPQVLTKKGKQASRLDDGGAKPGAQRPPKVERERTSAVIVAPAEDHLSEARWPWKPLSKAEGEPGGASGAIGAVEKRKIVCTRRYTEAPFQRWVGRFEGRRCLFSCSTSPYIIASHPSFSGGTDPFQRAVGRPRGERRAGCAYSWGKYRVDAHSTYVAFIPKPITSHAGKIDHPSAVEAQQHVAQVFRAEGIQPPRAWSGRPLCRNCGRRALLRLVVHTNLLAQNSLQSRVWQSERASLLLTPDKSTLCNEFIRRGDDGIDCGRTAPNYFRGGRGHGCTATVAPRGKFGSGVCRSGAVLCKTCLGMLRSAEIPLEQAAATTV